MSVLKLEVETVFLFFFFFVRSAEKTADIIDSWFKFFFLRGEFVCLFFVVYFLVILVTRFGYLLLF